MQTWTHSSRSESRTGVMTWVFPKATIPPCLPTRLTCQVCSRIWLPTTRSRSHWHLSIETTRKTRKRKNLSTQVNQKRNLPSSLKPISSRILAEAPVLLILSARRLSTRMAMMQSPPSYSRWTMRAILSRGRTKSSHGVCRSFRSKLQESWTKARSMMSKLTNKGTPVKFSMMVEGSVHPGLTRSSCVMAWTGLIWSMRRWKGTRKDSRA